MTETDIGSGQRQDCDIESLTNPCPVALRLLVRVMPHGIRMMPGLCSRMTGPDTTCRWLPATIKTTKGKAAIIGPLMKVLPVRSMNKCSMPAQRKPLNQHISILKIANYIIQ